MTKRNNRELRFDQGIRVGQHVVPPAALGGRGADRLIERDVDDAVITEQIFRCQLLSAQR